MIVKSATSKRAVRGSRCVGCGCEYTPHLHQEVRSDDRSSCDIGGALGPWAKQGAGAGGGWISPIPRPPARQGAGAAMKASTKSGRRLGLPRCPGRQAVYWRHPQHDLRGGPPGARSAQLLGVRLGAADGHQIERGRAVASRPVLKAGREHIAASGAYDILDIEPAWTPSLADGGVIAPLDDYMAKYRHGRPCGISSALQGAAHLQEARVGLLR